MITLNPNRGWQGLPQISQYIYLYKVQNCDLKEWEQENIEVACLQVPKPTEENQL